MRLEWVCWVCACVSKPGGMRPLLTSDSRSPQSVGIGLPNPCGCMHPPHAIGKRQARSLKNTKTEQGRHQPSALLGCCLLLRQRHVVRPPTNSDPAFFAYRLSLASCDAWAAVERRNLHDACAYFQAMIDRSRLGCGRAGGGKRRGEARRLSA